MGTVGFTQRLDSMVLEVFPNLNASASPGAGHLPKSLLWNSPQGWMQHQREMSLRRECHCVSVTNSWCLNLCCTSSPPSQ